MTAEEIAKIIIKAFKNGNKLLIVGNGGSAAQSQHLAAELVGKFEHKRKPLPALALTTDTSILTAIANDSNFNQVFRRQVEALGKQEDILLALTTSGKSENILQAQDAARLRGMKVVSLPYDFGKEMSTAEIQEVHLKMIHDICRIVEEAFL